MDIVVYLFVFVFIMALGYFIGRKTRMNTPSEEVGALKAEIAHEREKTLQIRAECDRRIEEKEEACRNVCAMTEQNCNKLLEEKDKAIALKEADCRERLKRESERCEKAIIEKNAEMERRMAENNRYCEQLVETLKEKFSSLAAEKLTQSTEGLSVSNRQQIDRLLAPLKEEIDKFKIAFEKNKDQQIANKASFDQAIFNLGKQALQIGKEAESLARALKSETKTQGNWGEMVLSNILDAVGFHEGRDFIAQAQEVDSDGNRLIPDVEILLPNNEKLLIDSKASITAYLNYTNAESEEARQKALKEHIISVRKHMEELSGKNYIGKIKGSQGYILMFIPNDGCTILAFDNDKNLAFDAFNRHVIIVNPSTLLLCLKIVALLRSREAQNENAEKIARAAAKMYDKFALFTGNFSEIGKKLKAVSEQYDKARKQLVDGNANVVKQMEALKDYGAVVSKQIEKDLSDDALSAAIDIETSAAESGIDA